MNYHDEDPDDDLYKGNNITYIGVPVKNPVGFGPAVYALCETTEEHHVCEDFLIPGRTPTVTRVYIVPKNYPGLKTVKGYNSVQGLEDTIAKDLEDKALRESVLKAYAEGNTVKYHSEY